MRENYGPHWAQPKYFEYKDFIVYYIEDCSCSKLLSHHERTLRSYNEVDLVELTEDFNERDIFHFGQTKPWHILDITTEKPWPIRSPLAELPDRQPPR